MNIGIIGTGNMGVAAGRAWARRGHHICFSWSRDRDKLARLATEVGGKAVDDPAEAAAFGDVVLVAVTPDQLDAALVQSGATKHLSGKPLLTCVSGLRPDFTGKTMGLPTERTESVAEEIARLVPGAHVVESLNATFAEMIAIGPQNLLPQAEVKPPTLPLCGDDLPAKQIVETLILDLGFEPLDLGPLSHARTLETLASALAQFAGASGYAPEFAIRILRGSSKGDSE